MLVAVQDSDDHPEQPEQKDDREKESREPDKQVLLVGERRHDPWREHDEEDRQAAEPEKDEPEERRGDAPRPRALPLLEKLTENRHERRRKSRVGDERADGVRDQKGDLERVDRAADAEVVPGDDLPDEPEDP